jgi:hypothetical protein
MHSSYYWTTVVGAVTVEVIILSIVLFRLISPRSSVQYWMRLTRLQVFKNLLLLWLVVGIMYFSGVYVFAQCLMFYKYSGCNIHTELLAVRLLIGYPVFFTPFAALIHTIRLLLIRLNIGIHLFKS